MVFDSLFFRGKAVEVQTNRDKNELTLRGNFIVITNPNAIVAHADPQREVGNTAPKLAVKMPFELQENEALISYLIRNKKRYFKVENIKKRGTVSYP